MKFHFSPFSSLHILTKFIFYFIIVIIHTVHFMISWTSELYKWNEKISISLLLEITFLKYIFQPNHTFFFQFILLISI